ncbi:MAG: hypothetical protein AAF773_16260 [Cyanobacteria bacterium P01_D01_bin.115]
MKNNARERQRLQQQKISELRHQLRYANDYRARDYIAMQIDAIRRHG